MLTLTSRLLRPREMIRMSGWPSGLRRQTQAISLPEYRHIEPSGPRMWAWVRIPLLTEHFELKNALERWTMAKFVMLGVLAASSWILQFSR